MFEIMCRDLVISLMMTTSDLCSSCKPWKKHKAGVMALFEEFHNQVWPATLSNSIQYCTFMIMIISAFNVVLFMPMMITIIQGDKEKALGLTPLEMMDRNFKHTVPSCQVCISKLNL